MTVTLDQVRETFLAGYKAARDELDASGGRFKEDEAICIEAGLSAVLDKHVREMLANAHAAGARDEMGANKVDYNYADRILKSVKGE